MSQTDKFILAERFSLNLIGFNAHIHVPLSAHYSPAILLFFISSLPYPTGESHHLHSRCSVWYISYQLYAMPSILNTRKLYEAATLLSLLSIQNCVESATTERARREFGRVLYQTPMSFSICYSSHNTLTPYVIVAGWAGDERMWGRDEKYSSGNGFPTKWIEKQTIKLLDRITLFL